MDMTTVARLREFLRGSTLREVSLGYQSVALIEPEAAALADALIGYAVDPSGQALAGTHEGDGRREWIVIGNDDLVGDPLFADTADPAWPVYTAAHGQGRWTPERVADSFPKFLAALELVREAATGRETPTALDANPLPEAEAVRLLHEIARRNPGAEPAFWEDWLRQNDG